MGSMMPTAQSLRVLLNKGMATPWAPLVLYLAFRVGALLANFDAMVLPVYEIHGVGNLAALASSDWSSAPWLLFYDNAGGQLAAGVLGALSYKVFGSSYFALKVGPLLTGAVLLMLLWSVLSRHAGPRTAAIGCYGLALAPPVVSRYSVMAMGNHYDGVLFSLVAIGLTLRAAKEPRALQPFFWAGVAAGWAVFMYLGSLLALGVLLLCLSASLWMRTGVRHLIRSGCAYAAGGALGVTPLFLLSHGTDGRAGSMVGALIDRAEIEFAGAPLLERLSILLWRTLPEAACFPGLLGLESVTLGRAYLVLIVLSGAVVLRCLLVRPGSGSSARLEREAPIRILLGFLLLYPLAHLAVLVSSDLMDIEHAMTGSVLLNRYFVPFYFFSGLLLACAIGAGTSSARPLARKWRAALGLGFLASVLCAAPIVRPSVDLFGVGLRYAGTNVRSYAGLLSRTLLRDESSGLIAVNGVEAKRLVEPFEGAAKADVLIGLGYVLSQVDLYGRDAWADPELLGALVEPYPAEWHRWLARGIGAHSRARLSAGSTSIEALVHPPRSAPESLRASYFEGLGIPVGYPLVSRLATEWDLTERIAEASRPEQRAAVWSGFGWDLSRRSERGIAAEQRIIEARKTRMLPVDRSALTRLELEQP